MQSFTYNESGTFACMPITEYVQMHALLIHDAAGDFTKHKTLLKFWPDLQQKGLSHSTPRQLFQKSGGFHGFYELNSSMEI
eukprot:scaffold177899_cov18-Prasinocladus_malaysianus.AAC.1